MRNLIIPKLLFRLFEPEQHFSLCCLGLANPFERVLGHLVPGVQSQNGLVSADGRVIVTLLEGLLRRRQAPVDFASSLLRP